MIPSIKTSGPPGFSEALQDFPDVQSRMCTSSLPVKELFGFCFKQTKDEEA